MKSTGRSRFAGFSLVEVVIALGIVAFAILAIFGALPVGLNVSHSSQDDTRSGQIAQDILTSLSSQAQTNYPNCVIKQSGTQTASDFSYNIVLDGSFSPYIFAADNEGHLVVPDPTKVYPYQVSVYVANTAPAGFDAGYAALVTVRVAWKPFAQTYRDFVRVITKY